MSFEGKVERVLIEYKDRLATLHDIMVQEVVGKRRMSILIDFKKEEEND